ncbi:MAG: protein kinase [Ktedonobacteraceae bacterium]|nr:protein kinase [Ktedonobacteraceae bacterium]
MECPYCKAQNRDGVRYCGSCGKQIDPSTTTSVPAATPGNSGSIPRSLLAGSRLQGGRYLIRQVLGEGGMGTALLAQDMRLDGKLVVIKELLSEQTDPQKKQEEVRNFKREVSTLAHIDHPLVPNVTDHFQEGMRYFMVQEYVEGENLEQRLERTKQPMRERDALICASEVLDILEYLAQQTPPIVHRDIKPANIIIGAKDKRAHLVDFGIARADETKNVQRKQTSALGTPGYAPPEQYQGNADPRADLYALGATLHHILTNRDPRNFPPFIYPPLRSLNAQISPDTERILSRELVNDINQRYQSAIAMKQDIDSVLQNRFGIAGNSSSYTLSNSGAMGAIGRPTSTNTAVTPNSLSNPNLPPLSNQPTAVSPPPPPPSYSGSPPFMPPPNYYRPLNMQSNQPKQPKQRRTGWLPILLVLLLLVLVLGSAFGFLYIRNNSGHKNNNNDNSGGSSATQGPAIPNAIGVTKIGNEYIGISDGSFAFNAGNASNPYKQQAVNLFKANKSDPSATIPLFDEALQHTTNDAEALIYREDMRVISSGVPYVTFVVGAMVTGDSTLRGVGNDDLQGAYVAQKEYNDNGLLHGGVKVRLLIANSGSQTQYADQVAAQIVQLAKTDPTFVGVMGWPYSSRSLEVVKTLTQAGIPMVSQTSSSDDLTNISPYFFRVAPANKIQGIVGARYAEHTLNARNAVLFVDPTDSYSQSLGQDFAQQFQADGNQIVATEDYTRGNAASISARVADALSHHPDIIYFSGYASDIDTLISDPSSGTIPIMGGDALYELSGYPHGGRGGVGRLHFTTFAYPDEWNNLGYKPLPAFFTDYPNDFDPGRQHHQGSPYGFTRADNDVILSYDAMVALLKGADNALKAGKIKLAPADLEQGLKQISGTNGFQGVSGQVTFGANGDPVNKAIVILHVSSGGPLQMEPMGPDQGRFLR